MTLVNAFFSSSTFASKTNKTNNVAGLTGLCTSELIYLHIYTDVLYLKSLDQGHDIPFSGLSEQWLNIVEVKSLFSNSKMSVLQGSVLGPMLFTLKNFFIPLLNTDTVIFTSAKNATIISNPMERISMLLHKNLLFNG